VGVAYIAGGVRCGRDFNWVAFDFDVDFGTGLNPPGVCPHAEPRRQPPVRARLNRGLFYGKTVRNPVFVEENAIFFNFFKKRSCNLKTITLRWAHG